MIALRKGRYKFSFQPTDHFALSNGNELYHVREFNGGTECEINVLREGNYKPSHKCVYSYMGEVQKAGESINVPEPERDRIRPIEIVKNETLEGTPARIFTNTSPARIEISPKFYNYPIQIRLFILCHEYAHLFYKTEWKVDALALKIFLQMGGNPSQAFYALTKVLSDNPQNRDRIERLFETLKINNYVS